MINPAIVRLSPVPTFALVEIFWSLAKSVAENSDVPVGPVAVELIAVTLAGTGRVTSKTALPFASVVMLVDPR
jgi:hypothetical protein